MPTPQHLMEAEAEADRLIQSLAEGDGTPDLPAGDTDPTLDTHPAGDDAEADGDLAPDVTDEKPEARGEAAGLAELQAKLDDLQTRFDTLQAKHDTLRGKTYAEVPRVLAENRSLVAEVAELKAKLAENVAQNTTRKPGPKSSELIASLKETVAEETVDQIQQLVELQVEERMAERVGKMEGNVESLQRSARQRAEDAYVVRLTQLVPDWQEKAASPEYSLFLAGRDRLSGEVLHTLATKALAELNAERQSEFFKAFDASGTAKAKADPVTPAAKSKEDLVTPRGAARPVNTNAEGDKQDRFTQRQLDQFNRNRRNMSAKAEAAMEARIDRAIQNRWIDP